MNVNAGDRVEVRTPWASAYGVPQWSWRSGYTVALVAREAGFVLVRAESGTFKGCVTRERAENVRREEA